MAEETRNKDENSEDVHPNEKFHNLRQALCALVGFLHYCNMGMTASLGYILVKQLQNENLPISLDQESWIRSIFVLPIGPISILTGLILQKVSKRTILISTFLVELTGWIIQYTLGANSVLFLIIGRFIIGIAIGMAAPILPLLVAEVSHPKTRGFYVTFMYLGLTVGIMTNNVSGAFLSWKTCVLNSSVISIINIVISSYLKESYVWHLKKNNVFKVRTAFYWYRGTNDEAKLEVSKYISDHLEKSNQINETMSFTKDVRGNIKLLMLPLFLTITLMTTMHLSGFKVIIFYSINIMEGVIPSLNVYIATIIVDVIRLFASILGCILVKKYSMRLLIIISGSGSALSHGLFCVFKYFSYLSEYVLSPLSLLSVVMYILFASIGLSALPWVLCSEIFPLKVKNIGSGISSFVFYVIFFLTIKYAPLLDIYFGVIGEFVFFGCCTAIGTILMYFFMPETKNRTLGDIEDAINGK